ncbi:MAG: hypothetical protein ACSLEZ_15705 [Thiobacillus sp.]
MNTLRILILTLISRSPWRGFHYGMPAGAPRTAAWAGCGKWEYCREPR